MHRLAYFRYVVIDQVDELKFGYFFRFVKDLIFKVDVRPRERRRNLCFFIDWLRHCINVTLEISCVSFSNWLQY